MESCICPPLVGSYGPQAREALAGVTSLVGDRTRTVARPVWLMLQLQLRLLRPCFAVPSHDPAAGGPWTRAVGKNGVAGPDCRVGTLRSCVTMNYLSFLSLALSTVKGGDEDRLRENSCKCLGGCLV